MNILAEKSKGKKLKKYEKVALAIKDDINVNPTIEKIPTEQQLCEKFNVSRDTIRSALSLLKNENIIKSVRGSGYFVNNAVGRLYTYLNSSETITEMIKNSNYEVGKIDEKIAVVHSSEYKQFYKGIEDFFLITRVRTADGIPVVYSEILIPVIYLGEDFPLKYRIGSLKEFLQEECNIITVGSDTRIVAYEENKDVIPDSLKGHPIVKLIQNHLYRTGDTALLSIDYIRSDMVELYVQRSNNYLSEMREE